MASMLPSPTGGQDSSALTLAESIYRGSSSNMLVNATLLLYDHLITFGDEVTYIWNRKKTPLSVLFLINRYFSTPAFVLVTLAQFSRDWTIEKSFQYSCFVECHPFAFLIGSTWFTSLVAEVMLMLRVYVVYQQKKSILFLLVPIWITQLVLVVFVLIHNIPAETLGVPVERYGCGLSFSNNQLQKYIVFLTVPPLVFDTTTFFLLVLALYRHAKANPRLPIINLILRDGCLYWFAVCCVNLTWTIFAFTVEDLLEYIIAWPSTTITIILIGHLTLNLRMHTPPLNMNVS